MLKRLTLENIAIIEALSVSFQDGLTVITGETGAGKSILMEAISLAFGARVSAKEILRSGSLKGRVELFFDLGPLKNQLQIRELLAQEGLELLPDETEILVSREFNPSGSRARLNGSPVSREFLETLRSLVLDIQGQHEITGLFQKPIQRACLDGLGGAPLLTLKEQVAQAYTQWLGLKQEIEQLLRGQREFQERRDYLEFQMKELTEANLTSATEDTDCQSILERLRNGERLTQLSAKAAQLLAEGEWEKTPAITDLLAKVQKALADGARLDSSLTVYLEKATALLEETKALSLELSEYQEQLEAKPDELQGLVDRVDLLEKLKRKYGPTLADVMATLKRVSHELEQEGQSDQRLQELQELHQASEERLSALCNTLSHQRQQIAKTFKGALVEELQGLALPSACFEVAFKAVPFSAEGADDIEFLFSANPGEPLRPLAKVASGGELARVLLGLKVLTAESGGVKTLVFDEIDTGMSGAAAKAVGEKLLRLSRKLQVLAITHQPIVAAMGDHHLHVQKGVLEGPAAEEDRVQVEVLELSDKEKRLRVLSRLASGIETSDEAVEKYIQRLLHEANVWKMERILQE